MVRDGRSIVQVSSKTSRLRGRRSTAGIGVESETDVIVSSPISDSDMDTPGRFGTLSRALADAGINIALVYMASGNRIVLATSDNARARELLQSTM